ncbi:MAG: hypothetical protein AAF656_11795 [Planctomycetota bacterium]
MRNALLVAGVILPAFGSMAEAVPLVIEDRLAFEGQLVGPTAVDFDGLADQVFTQAEIRAGVVFDGFSIRGVGPVVQNGDIRIVDGEMEISVAETGMQVVQLFFDEPTAAFGADYSQVSASSVVFTTQSGGPLLGSSDQFDDAGFIGVIDDQIIDRFQLSVGFPSQDTFRIDGLIFGQIPEPAVLGVSSLGLLALRRRRG